MKDKILTTNQGVQVTDNQNSLTVGPRGPVLLQDVHLIEKLAHFDRERIPERVVHAKGAGAYGYFEVTRDVTRYTPLKFPDFIHTQKRNPKTNLKDPDMFWDFLSLTPESIHQVTILFSDRGTPRTFRNMNGYGSHTYKWFNEKNEYFWV